MIEVVVILATIATTSIIVVFGLMYFPIRKEIDFRDKPYDLYDS